VKYYAYYPGCSMEATAVPVELSIQAIAKPLDMDLSEIEDWTCCGSSPYGSVNKVEAVTIASRILALAEKTGLDLVTACSSCYIVLSEARSLIKENAELAATVRDALATVGLEYKGTVHVRHLVEVLFNDIGVEAIAAKVVKPLTGLKVACYYGCQQVRPRYGFDDPEMPQWLDLIAASLGAEPVPFPLKARCCGSSLIISEEDVALQLINKLLTNASENGAQCIASTTCPLCHTNLDAYQSIVKRRFKANYNLPVLAITQLIGVALGLDYRALGLHKNTVSPKDVLAPYKSKLQEVKT